jgi:hypothetical protein
MRYRNVLSITAIALALAGCDGRFKSRIVVIPNPSANGSGLTRRAAAVVARYAKDNGIPCTAGPESTIYCFRQPTHIFVVPAANGVSVCYLAMGAQFEQRKFAARIDQLQKRVVEEFGAPAVASAVPKGAQCMIPRS